MSEQVIAPEVAEAEFERFCEAMRLKSRIQFKERVLSSEDLASFREAKAMVVASIECGALVILEDGEAEYTPFGDGSPIRFRKPKGGDLMDPKGNPRKGYGAVAAITRQPEKRFNEMDYDDLQNVMSVVSLFFV